MTKIYINSYIIYFSNILEDIFTRRHFRYSDTWTRVKWTNCFVSSLRIHVLIVEKIYKEHAINCNNNLVKESTIFLK